MKSLNKLALAAGALLALYGSSAQADTTIRITGSTAYRAAVHNAIAHVLTNPVAVFVGTTGASGLSGANQAVFGGTISGHSELGNVYVETVWNGSISGIAALVQNNTNLAWIAPSTLAAAGATSVTPDNPGSVPTTYFSLSPGASGGVGVSSYTADSSKTADLAFSDAYQEYSPFAPANGYTLQNEFTVGIIPFTYIKSVASTLDHDYGMWTRLTNISSQQAYNLYSGGSQQAGYVTGSTLDTDTSFVFAVGRDIDSGTRYGALSESEIGATASITQWILYGTSGNTGSITSIDTNGSPSSLTAASPGYNYLNLPPTTNVGGYNSGGTLGKFFGVPGIDNAFAVDVIGSPSGGEGGYPVGYISFPDAETLLNYTYSDPSIQHGSSCILTYNGVAPSLTNINNGTYQFWEYEHYDARPGVPAGTSGTTALTTFYGLLKTRVQTDADVAGYKFSQINSNKAKEGALITPAP